MKSGFPKTTLLLLAGLMAFCVLFDFLMMHVEGPRGFYGFVLVPILAVQKIASLTVSPLVGASVFWTGTGTLAALAWTRRSVFFPALLAVYSAVVVYGAWQQACALWKC